MPVSTEREFLRHANCPKCGSRDNLAIYSDGKESCFSSDCGYYKFGDGEQRMNAEYLNQRKKKGKPLIQGEVHDLPARKITAETAKHMRYYVGECPVKNTKCQIATYTDENGKQVAQKIRYKDKSFRWTGDPKSAVMFGQGIYKSGGRILVITEGEIDACSVSQAQGNRYPVISLKDGASAAERDIRNNIEYIESFEKVILMFDNDEAGIKAAQKVAPLISGGKCFIATLPLKDANELLKANRSKEIVDAVFRAKEYTPDSIVKGSAISLKSLMAACVKGFTLPFKKLNDMLMGIRKREIILFTAGSGIGKSTLVTQIKHFLLRQDKLVFANIFLEESIAKTAQRDIALYHNVPLKMLRYRPEMLNEEQWKEAKEKVIDPQIYHDHFGSVSCAELISKINYFALQGVDFVVLDHISIVVSGQDSGANERKDIDVLMTRLREVVERTGIGVIAIVHLKRSDGKNFNEGAQVSLTDLRGSASLEQLSDSIISAERNQQDNDGKNEMLLRVLKNREAGETGEADLLTYNTSTGWIEPASETQGVLDDEDLDDWEFDTSEDNRDTREETNG